MRRLIIIIMLTAVFCSCTDTGGDEITARVNGEPIYKKELALALKFELTKYDPKIAEDLKRVDEIKKVLLDDLIKKRILYSAAKQTGITMTENELAQEYIQYKSRYTEATFQKMLELKGIKYEAWKEDKKREATIDKLIEQEVAAKIDISDSDIKKYYRRHQKEFSRGDEVHARQILVDDEKLAEQIHAKITAGENFAALAQEYSIAPEGKRGGDLGWFARGIMPKAFDEACFPLPASDISPIVKTEFGYHIFKVLERRGAESAKIEDVKDKIIARLKQEKIEEAFNKWYEPLKKKANVDINKDAVKQITTGKGGEYEKTKN